MSRTGAKHDKACRSACSISSFAALLQQFLLPNEAYRHCFPSDCLGTTGVLDHRALLAAKDGLSAGGSSQERTRSGRIPCYDSGLRAAKFPAKKLKGSMTYKQKSLRHGTGN